MRSFAQVAAWAFFVLQPAHAATTLLSGESAVYNFRLQAPVPDYTGIIVHIPYTAGGDTVALIALVVHTYSDTDALGAEVAARVQFTVAGMSGTVDAAGDVDGVFSVSVLNSGGGPVTLSEAVASLVVCPPFSHCTTVGEIAGASTTAGGTGTSMQAVEYYHQQYEHYFVTSYLHEIVALDEGTITGWWRTGQRYKVETHPAGNRVPVCRFFTDAFANKASHFYSASNAECEYVKKNLPAWRYEGIAFYVTPAEPHGACASGTAPVYRLYNNGRGGAPNHAYTADTTKRDLLLSVGFVAEGIAWCVPIASADASEQTRLLAGTTWELSENTAIYGDGRGKTTFAAQLSTPGQGQWKYDLFGMRQPPAAIYHQVNDAWTGYAHFEPLTGHTLLIGSSGFEGTPFIGGAWQLDSVSGASTTSRAFAVMQNIDSRYAQSIHPFQTTLWSGGTPGVSTKLIH